MLPTNFFSLYETILLSYFAIDSYIHVVVATFHGNSWPRKCSWSCTSKSVNVPMVFSAALLGSPIKTKNGAF